MKILLVHNYYKQRGGEDVSFEEEASMLKKFGHEVEFYTRHNDDIDYMSKSKVAIQSTWNRRTLVDVKSRLSRFRPDVIHCTNLFPLISPSVYDAAAHFDVPVVQSLRNYRQMCINSLYFREGKICEQCSLSKLALAGIRHKCYRDSRVGSVVVAAANYFHKMRGTWNSRVDRFFTPTQFAREKFIAAGFPENRIRVKPNFLFDDPGEGESERSFALFVGRLSPEKGLNTLLEVWKKLDADLPLKIVGKGYLSGEARRAAESDSRIEYSGEQPLEEVTRLLGQAKFLVMPSEWYETFGRTMMEAFSKGTPVIASDLGAMSELVISGFNGLRFEPGNQKELANCILQLHNNEEERKQLGRNARACFVEKYTCQANHQVIMDIYKEAVESKRVEVAGRTQLGPISA